MMRFSIYCLLVTCVATLASKSLGETVEPLDDSWQTLAMVTGFHSFRDKSNGMDVRLLEASGDVTVAINSVNLYFVVTNNSSAGDLQEHVWRLPFRVQSIRSTKQIQSGIIITAVQETNNTGNSKRNIIITVSYHV